MENKSAFQELLEKYIEESKLSETKLILSDTQKRTLITIARNTLKSYLERGEIPEVITDEPALMHMRATFVTLRNSTNNELRGCKGEIFPTKPLIESVQHTAISTATNDPRFPSIKADELNNIKIEISILLPVKSVKPEDIKLGVHGLIVVKGDNSALLLPHVPIYYKLDKERFLDELCIKAGLPGKSWKEKDTSLYGFEAEVFEEND